ncbi:MAG: hypothetical protein KAT00_04015 [Planctomycetes bacterium]|nr:hypothetical protein [Planctomycetota bacterium]
MKKMQVIIFAAAGLLSFGGVFGITLLMKGPAPVAAETAPVQDDTLTANATSGLGVMDFSPGTDNLSREMSEKQLKGLIYDIREKMKEYRFREKELLVQEERIQTARETLQKDIEQLNGLNARLAAMVGNIKQQQDELDRSTIEISEIEATNMQKIANTYNTMDSAQSSKILISMASHNQLNDAVMILYYMTERTAGKLLGEISSAQPELASMFCMQLKRIRESN